MDRLASIPTGALITVNGITYCMLKSYFNLQSKRPFVKLMLQHDPNDREISLVICPGTMRLHRVFTQSPVLTDNLSEKEIRHIDKYWRLLAKTQCKLQYYIELSWDTPDDLDGARDYYNARDGANNCRRNATYLQDTYAEYIERKLGMQGNPTLYCKALRDFVYIGKDPRTCA